MCAAFFLMNLAARQFLYITNCLIRSHINSHTTHARLLCKLILFKQIWVALIHNLHTHKLVNLYIGNAPIYLNCTIFGWFNFRKCLMSVSFCSRTFFTATISFFNFPLNTAPCAPDPSHCKSLIVSNGISQSSVIQYS